MTQAAFCADISLGASKTPTQRISHPEAWLFLYPVKAF
nr:MAG TPA: hypothetical protein [Caudoviricetes sp.]